MLLLNWSPAVDLRPLGDFWSDEIWTSSERPLSASERPLNASERPVSASEGPLSASERPLNVL